MISLLALEASIEDFEAFAVVYTIYYDTLVVWKGTHVLVYTTGPDTKFVASYRVVVGGPLCPKTGFTGSYPLLELEPEPTHWDPRWIREAREDE